MDVRRGGRPGGSKRAYLTVKGEVTKQRRQHVHDEHGHDGQVGDPLHFPAAAAVCRETWKRN